MTRNRKIMRAVIRGYTLAQVGSVFGTTGTRARQITLKEAHRIVRKKGLSLCQLREGYRNRLLAHDATESQ